MPKILLNQMDIPTQLQHRLDEYCSYTIPMFLALTPVESHEILEFLDNAYNSFHYAELSRHDQQWFDRIHFALTLTQHYGELFRSLERFGFEDWEIFESDAPNFQPLRDFQRFLGSFLHGIEIMRDEMPTQTVQQVLDGLRRQDERLSPTIQRILTHGETVFGTFEEGIQILRENINRSGEELSLHTQIATEINQRAVLQRKTVLQEIDEAVMVSELTKRDADTFRLYVRGKIDQSTALQRLTQPITMEELAAMPLKSRLALEAAQAIVYTQPDVNHELVWWLRENLEQIVADNPAWNMDSKFLAVVDSLATKWSQMSEEINAVVDSYDAMVEANRPRREKVVAILNSDRPGLERAREITRLYASWHSQRALIETLLREGFVEEELECIQTLFDEVVGYEKFTSALNIVVWAGNYIRHSLIQAPAGHSLCITRNRERGTPFSLLNADQFSDVAEVIYWFVTKHSAIRDPELQDRLDAQLRILFLRLDAAQQEGVNFEETVTLYLEGQNWYRAYQQRLAKINNILSRYQAQLNELIDGMRESASEAENTALNALAQNWDATVDQLKRDLACQAKVQMPTKKSIKRQAYSALNAELERRRAAYEAQYGENQTFWDKLQQGLRKILKIITFGKVSLQSKHEQHSVHFKRLHVSIKTQQKSLSNEISAEEPPGFVVPPAPIKSS